MDHKTAAKILIALSEKPELSVEEKEALMAAIGVLSWTQLAQSRLKNWKGKSRKS